ncbi:hypothetical protein DSECCO2_538200 [anaerobic digester metagenome]
MGYFKTKGEAVHTADMGDEQVLKIGGIAPSFRIEVQTAIAKPAVSQDHQHRLGGLVHVGRELIGIPAVD